VDNCHKLYRAGLPRMALKGRLTSSDIKEDALCAEVLRRLKCDWEGDTSMRHN
jgi:hypothetical protein